MEMSGCTGYHSAERAPCRVVRYIPLKISHDSMAYALLALKIPPTQNDHVTVIIS